MSTESASVFDRTFGGLRRAWHDLAESTRVRLTGALRPDLPSEDRDRLRQQIDECLAGLGGDVSARARAAELGRTYLGFNEEGRSRFLELLAYEYGISHANVGAAIAQWQKALAVDANDESASGNGNDARNQAVRAAEKALRDALHPPRIKLLAQFNGLPQGVKFLVDLRAELIPLARRDPVLKSLDDDLRELLASWFDIGFLELRTISWDAPASLLEKLAHYEAVHAIESWADIKHRLAPDRRCYAFFHPQMPDEPLIYVWVALVKGMADNVQKLLDIHAPSADPENADSAIFYSISNAQKGLAGVSFGNFLIKRVVASLARDFKKLRTFATLSPIPGFRRWLDERLNRDGDGDGDGDSDVLLTDTELRRLQEAAQTASRDVLPALLENNDWVENAALCQALQAPLMRLCASYLAEAKRGIAAADRVAHFHLANGARLERINWLADRSEKGIKESAGMMINYLYRSNEIEQNHESYTADGVIVMSASVKSYLKRRPERKKAQNADKSKSAAQ